MVETQIQGDGIERKWIYGKWRTDKDAEPGYSHELINVDLEP